MIENKASLYDIVTLQNIDNEDFLVEYNISDPQNGYQGIIPAGQIKRLPFFIADHALKHLISKILLKRKMKANNPHERAKLREKIVIDVELMNNSRIMTPQQQAIDKIKDYNKTSDLTQILAKRKAKAPIPPVAPIVGEERVMPPAQPEPPVPTHRDDPTILPEDKEEEFPDLKNKVVEAPVASQAPATPAQPELAAPSVESAPTPPTTLPSDTEVVTSATPVGALPPSRETLYNYAKKTLGMTFDTKTIKYLDALDIPALINEFDYPQ